jgi:hypothetical protein
MAAKPRKQSATKAVTTSRIRVLISFNGMYAGDEADVVIDKRVQGWINANMVKVLSTKAVEVPQVVEPPKKQVTSDATSKVGPVGSDESDQGSEQGGADGSGAPVGEPGEGTRTRRHRKTESVDPS